jgi:hypothetical protein
MHPTPDPQIRLNTQRALEYFIGFATQAHAGIVIGGGLILMGFLLHWRWRQWAGAIAPERTPAVPEPQI